jgi:hypothetical protein
MAALGIDLGSSTKTGMSMAELQLQRNKEVRNNQKKLVF